MRGWMGDIGPYHSLIAINSCWVWEFCFVLSQYSTGMVLVSLVWFEIVREARLSSRIGWVALSLRTKMKGVGQDWKKKKKKRKGKRTGGRTANWRMWGKTSEDDAKDSSTKRKGGDNRKMPILHFLQHAVLPPVCYAPWQRSLRFTSVRILVVTHPMINQPACGLGIVELTESPVFHTIWSYVTVVVDRKSVV